MERYFPTISRSSSSRSVHHPHKSHQCGTRYSPYPRPSNALDTTVSKVNHMSRQEADNKIERSASALTKKLLNSLQDKCNPITNSDIAARSDRVISTTSGHQVAEDRPNRRLYSNDRERKLLVQRTSVVSSSGKGLPLASARVYIGGYLSGTTDIEMKRLIAEAGGHVVYAASGCTHILSSQSLKGSKMQKLLTMQPRTKPYVVRPEWVTDSIKSGKRRSERLYSVIEDINTISDMLQK
ncbi:hypothetical protein BDQ12DRAFT_674921 [Crucibulum laeve]|uniref:BRCT domain-containing protein n=1 Tax=Crucibulum laeve TaxID=68775 RepID=A0A5C3MFJ0_9AGAR|nr:hypothetical protein BDQ12DRAFT_674921 [Crucibulum laeve]